MVTKPYRAIVGYCRMQNKSFSFSSHLATGLFLALEVSEPTSIYPKILSGQILLLQPVFLSVVDLHLRDWSILNLKMTPNVSFGEYF